MRSFFLTLTILGSTLISTSPLRAEEAPNNLKVSKDGWYATFGSGFVSPQSPSTSLSVGGVNFTGNIQQNTSYSGELGVGYDFGKIRTEFTYGYTPISSSNWNVNWSGGGSNAGSASAPVSTSYNLNSFLFGAYYDIPTKSKWTPYIGGAIGPGVVSIPALNVSGSLVNSITIGGNTYNNVSIKTNSTTENVFAYQAKAGLSYAASPETDLFVEAGYLGTSSLSTTPVITSSPSINASIPPLTIGQNGGFQAKIGFRYRFGK